LIDRRRENSDPTSGAQRGTIENAMSDDSIPDRSRLLVCSRFALQQSMKEEPSRKTRTIEFMRFTSMRWTLDDFLPARRVERRLQMRVIEHVRALDVVIANIDRSADFSTRNERCATPSRERVRCVSHNASLNDSERWATKIADRGERSEALRSLNTAQAERSLPGTRWATAKDA